MNVCGQRLPRAGWALGLVVALSACGPAGSAPAASTAVPPFSGASSSGIGAGSPPQSHTSIAGKIAFSRAGNIWVYTGSAAQQATAVLGAADPAWSPDGTTLAFDKQDKNSADLYVMPYPNGQPRPLSANANRVVANNLWEMQPDWSPDGLSLAYVGDRGRLKTGVLDPALWRVTLGTGARVQLASGNQYTGGIDFPRWRPHYPSEVLYTSWAYEPQALQPYGQLLLEDVKTSRRQALTTPDGTSFQPSWSPDGSAVAFVKRQQQRSDLWIMPVADDPLSVSGATPPATAARLLVQGAVAHPVWAPDGRGIAYLDLKDGSFDLFVQALTADQQPAGPATQLTNGWRLEAASAISWGR